MAKKKKNGFKKPYEEEPVGKFPVGFYFSATIGDESEIDFQEVSGLSKELNIEEVASGGENRFKYRLPAMSTSKNLILKRAIVLNGSSLLDWCQDCIDGGLMNPIVTKIVSVNLLDKKGYVSMKWTFQGAYPIKYSVSDLKSVSNEVLIESVELAYTYFDISPAS